MRPRRRKPASPPNGWSLNVPTLGRRATWRQRIGLVWSGILRRARRR